MPTTGLDGDTLIQILLALIFLGQAGKAVAWFLRRPDSEATAAESRAKEQTREMISRMLKDHEGMMQSVRETRAVSTETRELVRGLREEGIKSAETDRHVQTLLTELRDAVHQFAGSIRELVAELRAERKDVR